MTPNPSRHDPYDSEVASSIKSLFELTSRIDERVKVLFENSSKIESKFNTIMELQNDLMQRITAVESREKSNLREGVNTVTEALNDESRKTQQTILQRVTVLETKNATAHIEAFDNKLRAIEIQIQAIEFLAKGHQNRWDNIVNNAIKLLIAVAAGFIIWHSGWNTPTMPAPAPVPAISKGP